MFTFPRILSAEGPNITYLYSMESAWPTQRPIQWVLGFLPGSEVDHSRPSTAVVKREWSYTSAPPIRLRGVDRGNIISTFTG